MDDSEARELDRAMARLADGDRGASQPVFDALWPVLVRFASRALGSASDGEDAAADAVATLFERASDYDATRPALPWALTLTYWECRTHQKRRARRREQSDAALTHVADAREAADDALDAERAREALLDALERLPETDRETLRAALDDAGAPRDAAFRKRKERAIGRLRRIWREIHGR